MDEGAAIQGVGSAKPPLPLDDRRLRQQLVLTGAYVVVAALAAVLPAAKGTFVSGPLHVPYIFVLGLAAAWAAWGAWTRFRLDQESSSYLTCAAFASLAVIYLPHAFYEETGLYGSNGADPAHIFFSPLSRIAFGLLLLAAMLRVPVPKALRRPWVGVVVLAVLAAGVVDLALHTDWLLERLGSDPGRSVRIVGSVEVSLQLAALAVMGVRYRRTRRRFLATLAPAVIALMVGGALIDFTSGWEWRWWIGHLGLVVAAVVIWMGTSRQLVRALDANELFLVYQPKVSLADGRLVGVEALIRWQHPDRGLVPPFVFIPVAEASEMIRPITLWVLGEAIDQHKRWLDAGLKVRIAVNLSARLLRDEHLDDVVRAALADRGVGPEAVELELTESAFADDPDRALRVIQSLAALDVPLAIDDFGTGYSSLSYLKRLPVSELKIDKAFITDLATDDSDKLIVRSTVEMAKGLGKTTVAEGVEDEAVAAVLRELGCDVGQGYLWSKPLKADELLAWERARQQAAPTAG